MSRSIMLCQFRSAYITTNIQIPNSISTFFISGLILGGGLIIFVCALSDEYGPRPMTSSRNVIKLSAFIANDSNFTKTSSYNYGWSFMLAVCGFLCSEISAFLCLTAFLNRFDSEVNISSVKISRFFVMLFILLNCSSLPE